MYLCVFHIGHTQTALYIYKNSIEYGSIKTRFVQLNPLTNKTVLVLPI